MDGDNGPTNKKHKAEDSVEDERSQYLKDFAVTKVLKEDKKAKMMALHGKFKGKDDAAVVLIERLPFDKNTVTELVNKSNMHQTLNNDIYSTYEAFPPEKFPDYKTTMIYPATEKHVTKYSEQDVFVVHETKELFEKVTQPCLKNSSFSVQWVHNILDKKCESERIVFEDDDSQNGFILLPDMKWNRKDMDSLYLVAITHRRDIDSLRVLNKSHLPLLRNILESGMSAIQKQFNIPTSKLRIYVHYQPSYYHLHVHFTHVKFDAPGTDVFRAHLLQTIIENIERDEHYYQNQTLYYTVRENDILYKSYKEYGYFN